jgi:signal transduction histidine kinase
MRYRKTWPIAAAALFGLLTLITASVLATASKADSIYAELDALNAHHRGIEARLRRLRSDVHLSGIFIRDYLLDPSRSEAQAYRAELTRLRDSHTQAIAELRTLTGSDGAVQVDHLAARVDEYWAAFDPVFDWNLLQKVLQSAAFLRKEVVPRREAVLGIAQEIEHINDANLAVQRAAVVQRQAAFRSDLRRLLWQTLIAGLLVSVIAVARLRVAEQRSQQQQRRAEHAEHELRDLSHGLVVAQEEERRKLSRELHDHVGQLLTAQRMSLARIERADDDGGRVQALQDARALTDELLQIVRDLSLGLRPSMLDDLGLTPALEWLVRDTQRRSRLPVRLRVSGPAQLLDENVRTCVYRIIQEALTNCVRHAAAQHVDVAVTVTGRLVSVEVCDDGQGMAREANRRGLGLLGIEERARELGGSFDITTGQNGGVRLSVQIPCHVAQEVA